MKTKHLRTELPVAIEKDGISYYLLSPLERHGVEAERMGISVLKVVVNTNTKEYPRLKDLKESMYRGGLHPNRVHSLWRELNYERESHKHTYFYMDKSYKHLEKKIRL